MKVRTVDLLSSEMMDGPGGSVSTLVVGVRLVHGTTLAIASGRVSLGWIVGVTVGCSGVMASGKIAVSCDRDSIFLLEIFS